MSSVVKLQNAQDPSVFGGKAFNLARLLNANLPVPGGLAVGLDSFTVAGELNSDAKKFIYDGLDKNSLYAVRSSALAEDAENASWAGQFETFLDVSAKDVVYKVEECHSSAKARVKAYAEDKEISDFNIAVVIQKMLHPAYAGVLFTKDPITNEDHMITEYVEGLGEELVSGRADPKQFIIGKDDDNQAPFNVTELAELGSKAQKVFGKPQDIEWVWADNKVWLVQARPITTSQTARKGYYLGEPEDLFYWGPSRAKSLYMSDFFAGTEQWFTEISNNPKLPNPPKTIALFDGGKMVWLSNAKAFNTFTENVFESYIQLNIVEEDMARWNKIIAEIPSLSGDALKKGLKTAWYCTEFAEFALYGAEIVITKMLKRFKPHERQNIWGAFSVPDKQTFLSKIDDELAELQDAKALATKYPWIQDGYDGLDGDPVSYFEDRLKIIGNEVRQIKNNETKRKKLAQQYSLTQNELDALKLARQLAEFMDDRKAWMMQTRRLIKQNIGNIKDGWYFDNGKSKLIGKEETRELWQRYVEFKSSTSAVKGIVASNGGKHFINGEVVVVNNPTDNIKDGQIVVVPSTSPSYVPLMRRAKALVTDHGGMMSHAAIVAREFNLPCIVGTKQATKVLKTGDKVILDLLQGEISK